MTTFCMSIVTANYHRRRKDPTHEHHRDCLATSSFNVVFSCLGYTSEWLTWMAARMLFPFPLWGLYGRAGLHFAFY